MPMLPPRKINWSASQESGHNALGGAMGIVRNLLSDKTGWMKLIPGTSAWDWFPSTIPNASPVIGMYGALGKLFYVTQDRKVWSVDSPGLVSARSDSTAATQLQGDRRPTFADDKSRVFIAGGGFIQYWETAGLSARVSSGPSTATHVVANAQRILANPYDNTGYINYTDPLEGSHLTGWDALNFFEAEARPDRCVGVYENGNQIFMMGTRTLQSFSPDANTDYAPVSTVNLGTLSPYSVITLTSEKMLAWFSNEKEIVVGNGMSAPTAISGDIASVLREIETYDDVFGWRMRWKNVDLWCWSFPTDGRCFAYEAEGKRWLELSGYSTTQGDWVPFPVTSYHYWEEEDVHLVGLSTGQIVKLDDSATTFAGQIIKGQVDVGFTDNGFPARLKMSNELVVPCRRGDAGNSSTSPPVMELFWRDNPGAWQGPVRLDLGSPGDVNPVLKKRLVGRPFYTRQYRLSVAAGVRVEFGPADETVEVLGG